MNLSLKHCLGGKILNKHGFKILKMMLRGNGKKDAEITFKEGLNVISGASNTGKTFIFQCINFLFGGKEEPKPVKESKGYEELYLEIQSYKNDTITIRRNLSDKKMFLYKCSMKDMDKGAPQIIGNQHDKDNEENISTILLKLCGAQYKNIVKNVKMETESFSYRYYVHLSMLSEKRIVLEDSPIYNGGFTTKTKDKNAFKTILTGIDNVLCENTKKNTTSKVKVQGKLELIDELLINSKKELQLLEESIEHDENSNISNAIAKLKEYINNENTKLEKLEKDKKDVWENLQKEKSEKLYLTELIKRFELLNDNYKSDFERIDFIDESEYYLNQLANVKCPLCNNKIEDVAILNNSTVLEAINIEREKLELQINDLASTIVESNKKIQIINSSIIDKNSLLEGLDKIIEENIKPQICEMLLQIEKLLKIQTEMIKKDYLNSRIVNMEMRKNQFIALSKQVKVVINEINLSYESLYIEFCKIVNEIFVAWKFKSDSTITFDEETMDLIINGDIKKTFGKGYCAIINSAFVIALMKYANKLNLPYPKIIVLDSPLTTFKEKDGEQETDEEEVNETVKQLFYEYLSEMNTGVQIIILDNVEPNKEIIEKINYLHFSGNKNVERSGFIPTK